MILLMVLVILTPPASPMMTVGVCRMGGGLTLCCPGDSMGGFMSVGACPEIKAAGAKLPPMSSGLTPLILAFWTQNAAAAAVDG